MRVEAYLGLVLDALGAEGVVEGGERLVDVGGAGRQRGDDARLGLATQTLLHPQPDTYQPRQFGNGHDGRRTPVSVIYGYCKVCAIYVDRYYNVAVAMTRRTCRSRVSLLSR